MELDKTRKLHFTEILVLNPLIPRTKPAKKKTSFMSYTLSEGERHWDYIDFMIRKQLYSTTVLLRPRISSNLKLLALDSIIAFNMEFPATTNLQREHLYSPTSSEQLHHTFDHQVI